MQLARLMQDTDDDCPAEERAADRRILEEFDRKRAAGEGFFIPGKVSDMTLAGEHPIKAWRRYRRIPQAALAKAAGIDRITLVRIKRKTRPQAATLERLATALDCPVDALAEDED